MKKKETVEEILFPVVQISKLKMRINKPLNAVLYHKTATVVMARFNYLNYPLKAFIWSTQLNIYLKMKRRKKCIK